MKLGEKISTKRKQNNMTQEQLAEYLGVSRQAISKWESDSAYPETEKLIRMSDLFHCTLDYLLKDSIDYEENEDSNGNAYSQENGVNWNIHLTGGRGIQEKKSERTIAGKPLWQVGKQADAIIAVGINAKGVIAIGLKARGLISIGLFSMGLFSLGAFSLGLISIGLFAAGLFAGGSFAFGVVTFGAISLGILSLGALSIGEFSVGALSIGKYIAIGDHASGMIALGDSKATGTLFTHLGESGPSEIATVKELLNENVPSFLNWFKDIVIYFL